MCNRLTREICRATGIGVARVYRLSEKQHPAIKALFPEFGSDFPPVTRLSNANCAASKSPPGAALICTEPIRHLMKGNSVCQQSLSRALPYRAELVSPIS